MKALTNKRESTRSRRTMSLERTMEKEKWEKAAKKPRRKLPINRAQNAFHVH